MKNRAVRLQFFVLNNRNQWRVEKNKSALIVYIPKRNWRQNWRTCLICAE